MQEQKTMLIELIAKICSIETFTKIMEAEEPTECELIQRQIDAAQIEYRDLLQKLYTVNSIF